jgi:hypothetical protein
MRIVPGGCTDPVARKKPDDSLGSWGRQEVPLSVAVMVSSLLPVVVLLMLLLRS